MLNINYKRIIISKIKNSKKLCESKNNIYIIGLSNTVIKI